LPFDGGPRSIVIGKFHPKFGIDITTFSEGIEYQALPRLKKVEKSFALLLTSLSQVIKSVVRVKEAEVKKDWREQSLAAWESFAERCASVQSPSKQKPKQKEKNQYGKYA
jgi:hypothetical protein